MISKTGRSPTSPVFVIGNPRSGTTLLRLLLTSHTCIHIPPECGFAVWLRTKYDALCESGISDSLISQYISDVANCRKFDTWQLDAQFLTQELQSKRREMLSSYGDLVASIYMCHATVAGKALATWGDKNNFHIRHLADLFSMFPGARILHIVRDPRDVACSYRALATLPSSSPYAPQLPTDCSKIAAEWSGNMAAFEVDCLSVGPKRVQTIKYEDLVRTPASMLMKICNWMQLEYEEQMLSFYEMNRNLQLEPKSTMDWKQKTLNQIDSDSVEKYRHELSTNDISTIERVSKKYMEKYGYDFEC